MTKVLKKICLSLCVAMLVCCSVMMFACNKPVEYTLSFAESEMEMVVGEKRNASVTLKENDVVVNDIALNWETSNSAVATVDKAGAITAVAEGEVTITVKYENASATIKVIVKEEVFTITVDPESTVLFEGEQETITATASNNKEYAWNWRSENEEVATVDENGVVTALKQGTAKIVVSFGKNSAEVNVEVQHEDVVLMMDRDSAEINVGDELDLVAIFSDGSTHDVTWTSSDPDVATVENGKVTAKKSGEVTITVKATLEVEGEISATCVVTINDVVTLAFPQIDGERNVGEVIESGITATMNGQPVEMSEIMITGEGCTIENGNITITASGKITITASYKGEEITREIVAWQNITNAEEFLAMQNNLGGYYRLSNDVDFGGKEIPAFSSWGTKAEKTFHGRFNGQGHSLSNFKVGKIGNDYSIFGYVDQGAIIENVALLNVEAKDRFSALVSWLEDGTIRNVFLHISDYVSSGALSENNPAGALCAKVQAKGYIENCVVVLDKFTKKTPYFGGVIGKLDKGGNIKNCQLIYNGDDVNVYAVDKSNGVAKVETSARYETVDAFYDEATGADLTLFDSNIWSLTKGCIPCLKGFTDEIKAEGGEFEIYKGNTLDLSFIKSKGHKLSLLSEYVGVTLENNILSVTRDAVDSKITVVATSIYNSEIKKNFEFTVNNEVVEVQWEDIPEVTWMQGEVLTHDVVVTFTINGVQSTNYTLEIEDQLVATIEGSKITYVGDGRTNVNLIYNGVVAGQKAFVSNMYIPVKTVDEFQNIGTDAKTMSYKYKLMNDLDFGGKEFIAFSSYKTQGKIKFTGIFDGDGHSISNLIPFFNKTDANDRDRSIFGFMDNGAIVRNVAFLGIRCYDRTGIVASWAQKGSIIENVLIDATYVKPLGNVSKNNPTGFICSKLQKDCVIKDCIVRLNVGQYINGSWTAEVCGGIVGINAGKIENCQLIYDDVLGVINLEYRNSNGTVVNSKKYADNQAFLNAETGADLTLYSDEYWVKPDGYVPHLKGFTDKMEITNDKILAGLKSKNLISDIKSKGHTVALKAPVDGVTLENGIMTIDDPSKVVGNEVVVVASSVYDPAIKCEFTIIIVRSQDELIATDKTEYKEGEPIMVTATTGTDADWVGIYQKGASKSIRYFYLGEGVNGVPQNMKEALEGGDKTALHIPAGNYQICYINAEGAFLAWKDIVVTEAAVDPSLLATDKKEYIEGEPIMVTATGTDADWVGIYQKGGSKSIRYFYLGEGVNGVPQNIRLSTLPKPGIPYQDLLPGDYEIRYFKGEKECIAWLDIKILPREENVVTVEGDNSYNLTVNKRVFKEGEAIIVTATDKTPGNKDWIGIQKIGEDKTRSFMYLKDLSAEGTDLKAGKTLEKGRYMVIVVPADQNAPYLVTWAYIVIE